MEFRSMRRGVQALSQKECEAILKRRHTGVLAVLGDGGYPYAVPINYAYIDGKIYLHCAKEGHKLDAVRREPKCSFCVVDEDTFVPEEYNTLFRSVILFGRMREITDLSELGEAAEKFGGHLSPMDSAEHLKAFVAQNLSRVSILELTPEHVTGKESIEYTRMRK